MLLKSWQVLQVFLVLLINPSFFAGQSGWTAHIKVSPDQHFQITKAAHLDVPGPWFRNNQRPGPRCKIWKCLSCWIDAERQNLSLSFHSERWVSPGLRGVTDSLLG